MRLVPRSELHRRALRRAAVAVGAGAALAGLALVALPSASVAAPAQAPANTGEPAISGTPVEGRILSTSTGTWTGSQSMTFAYRWVRCGQNGGLPDGSNCVRISGATGRAYEVRRDDVDYRLRVRVTATNSSGSATAASNATVTVVARRPQNVTSPAVSGSAVEGATLQASPGTWTGEQPMTFDYQWLRCSTSGDGCGGIGSASSSTYQVRSNDVGRTLRVQVVARNGGGSRGSRPLGGRASRSPQARPASSRSRTATARSR